MLPHCINHLRESGIEKIVVLDNESTDNSAQIALDHGVAMISFSSDGLFCEETMTRAIRNTIDSLPSKFDWVLKIDADEFLYPSGSNETLHEFIERTNREGFNCAAAFSHQTYPMSDEARVLELHFDPLKVLSHVIPHVHNDKYSLEHHALYRCIWKVNVFHRGLQYKNPHYVSGTMRLHPDLLLLRHIPYTTQEASRERLLEGRKKRLSKRNFEIGLSTHYQELSDNDPFTFDHLRASCFDWDYLLRSYRKCFNTTLGEIAKKLNTADPSGHATA